MGSLIVVDVESDGQLISTNSLVCFGAVFLNDKLDNTFYGQTAPISKNYDKEALAISGFTREEHERFPLPETTMKEFHTWLKQFKNPVLISDNNGYDASWINYYLLRFVGSNPFGWSSRRIGDLFCGFFKDPYYSWKKHRNSIKYPHNHNPLSDTLGNASALQYLNSQGLNLYKE